MSDPRSMPDTDEILAHTEWIQRLARRLTRDPHLADDLAQATCVAALERPPAATSTDLRAWLGKVLRNLLLQTHRSERRRRSRELEQAPPSSEPPTSEVVARAQHHRSVFDEVLLLEEPYRTAILMRFFEDLRPNAIARRLDIPATTVHSRIGRGLQRLRARLEQRAGGDRKSLCALLLTLLPEQPSLGYATGALLMKSKTILITAAGFLALAALWPILSADRTTPDPVTTDVIAATTGEPTDGTDSPDQAQRASVRPADTTPNAAPDPNATTTFDGRALDAGGLPLAGVTIRCNEQSTVTDSAGRFVLPAPTRRDQDVRIQDDHWTTVVIGSAGPNMAPDANPVVVGAPVLVVGGQITDAHGSPLPGALVECRFPDDFRTRFDTALDYTRLPRWTTHSAADGRYRFEQLGRIEGATIRVTLDGYLRAYAPQPDHDSTTTDFVLEIPEPVDGALLGQVLDASGGAVAGAHVSAGGASTTSAPDGRFVLPLADAGKTREVVAFHRGHLPGRHELPSFDSRPNPLPFVFLRLGAEPMRIRGRVVDADGRGVAHMKVWVDAPEVATIGDDMVSVEAFLGGGLRREELYAKFLPNGVPILPIDQILDETSTCRWGWVMTDEDGAFEIGGLADRSYSLEAIHADNLVRARGGPFAAGTDAAILVVPDDVIAEKVAGIVVSASGEPMAGVELTAIGDGLRLERVIEHTDGRRARGSSSQSQPGASTVTDDQGRFEFDRLAKDGIYLDLTGDRIVPRHFGSTSKGFADVWNGPLDQMRIPVLARVHFRVELSSPERADRFSVLDADGKTERVHLIQADGHDMMTSWPIRDGKTAVLSVSERVTTFVFSKDGVELERVPVGLSVGQVNVVTF